MTQTLPKRTGRTSSPHHPCGGGEARGPHRRAAVDAADLAAGLRALAIRAHRALQDARGRIDPAALRTLRGDLLGLEADLCGQDLDGLVSYVQALRHRVEHRLG